MAGHFFSFLQSSLKIANLYNFCSVCLDFQKEQIFPKTLHIKEGAVRDNLQGKSGETGSTHPLLMLAHALEDATPNHLILVVGFGQGCDALLFRTTEEILDQKPTKTVSDILATGRTDDNYHRYLAINELVTIDRGLRAEVDKQTGLTTLYRNKDMLLGLIGVFVASLVLVCSMDYS